MEKGGSTPVFATQKKFFPLKRTLLGESQRPVKRLSNQISCLRLETHLFFSFLTYVKLTVMLHHTTHDFLGMESLVRNSFQSEVFHLRAAMKTQRFSNI